MTKESVDSIDIVKKNMGESQAWSMVAQGYHDLIQAFSEFHKYAIKSANVHQNDVVLDLACGSGALTRLIYKDVSKVYCYDFSKKMVHLINSYIELEDVDNIFPTVGDGQNLIYKDRLFDKVFSIFGLKFFPDRVRGLLETKRVLKPNGTILLAIWCPMKELEMVYLIMRAINSVLPYIEIPEHVSSMDSEEVITDELTGVGFKNIEIEKKSFKVPFDSLEDMFDSFIKGGPLFAPVKKSMGKDEWISVREKCLSFIYKELNTSDNVQLPMTCFYAKAQKPEEPS